MADDFVSEIDNYKIGDDIVDLNGRKGKQTQIIIDNMKVFEAETGKHAIHNGITTGQFEAWLWKFDTKKAKQNEELLITIRKILE